MVDKQSKSSHLAKYRFKPGQSGNPKGRPKLILSKHERLELLSEMAKFNKHKANPVEAIREQNRMEHVYEESPQWTDNRQYNFIVQSEESRKKVALLLKGERPAQLVRSDVTARNKGTVEKAEE